MIKCPHCGNEFALGSIKSEKKSASSRENGKKGGRPKGSRNKPKVPVVSPAGIVAEVTKRWEEEL